MKKLVFRSGENKKERNKLQDRTLKKKQQKEVKRITRLDLDAVNVSLSLSRLVFVVVVVATLSVCLSVELVVRWLSCATFS